MDKLKRPDAKIKLDSYDQEIVMNYLLMTDILKFLGSPEEATTLILTSADMRDVVVRRIFTDTEDTVEKEEDLIPSGKVPIDFYDVEALLAWVLEHVTYFFMKMSLSVQEKTKGLTQVLEKAQEEKS